MRILILSIPACALIALALAQPAAAQDEPGVIADPKSPAGKEYAIPLDEARREAGVPGGGGGSDGGSDSGSGPGTGGATATDGLFGVGVSPQGSDQSSGRPEGPVGGDRPEAVPAASSGRLEATVGDEPPAPLLLIAGSTILVLLLGATLGPALRRLDDGTTE